MQTFKWEDNFTGEDYNRLDALKRPCIYGWFRRTECLYIGKSEFGISRIIGAHHVIGVKDWVQKHDKFLLFFPEIRADDTLDFWEVRLIREHKPRHNIIRYATTSEQAMQEPNLQETICPKETLAALLSSDLQNRALLGNSQNRGDRGIKDFSEGELREFLMERKQIKVLIKKEPKKVESTSIQNIVTHPNPQDAIDLKNFLLNVDLSKY